jgi:hypothetical protein
MGWLNFLRTFFKITICYSEGKYILGFSLHVYESYTNTFNFK